MSVSMSVSRSMSMPMSMSVCLSVCLSVSVCLSAFMPAFATHNLDFDTNQLCTPVHSTPCFSIEALVAISLALIAPNASPMQGLPLWEAHFLLCLIGSWPLQHQLLHSCTQHQKSFLKRQPLILFPKSRNMGG